MGIHTLLQLVESFHIFDSRGRISNSSSTFLNDRNIALRNQGGKKA